MPWRGRDFTEEEEAGFDVEKLVGVPCTVTVINNAGDDGAIYANVSAVAPSQKKAERLSPSAGYVRVKDRPPKEQAAAMADPNKDEVPF